LGVKEVINGRDTRLNCLASITQQRLTKEKDRVEIHPEQMSEAMNEADKLGK
jgi:hypothetical protein